MADPRRPPPPLAAAWSPAARGDSPTDEPLLADALEFEAASTKDHELDVVTNALADRELDDLLAEDRRHRHSESSITKTLAGDELSELLAASRHRSMATIPDVNVELLAKTEGQKSEPELPSPAAEEPPLGNVAKIMELIEEEMARPSAPIADGVVAPQLQAGSQASPGLQAGSQASPGPPPPAIPRAPAPQAFTPPMAPTPSAASPPSPARASPGAWAVGQPGIASARPGLSSLPEWADASLKPKRRRQMLMIGGGVAILAIGLAFALSDSDSSPEPANLPSATAETPAPPPPPPKPANPTPSQAEIDAREALTKLRDGIGDCIRHGIGTLPGSSPAIPASLKTTKAPGYTPTPADWRTAVWSCARFRLTAPMRFQVQWQLVKPSAEGIGVVWIDENGDGAADRALGFRVTLKGKRDPTLGEISPIDAAQAVLSSP